MTNLLILGAGGHAKVVAETAIAGEYASSIAFLDDCFDGSDSLTSVLNWPVIGTLKFSLEPEIRSKFASAVVAIGKASVRLKWIEKLQEAGFHLPVLMHPTSWVSGSVQIGSGSVVFANATAQADALLGKGCILNTGCSIDHDTQLGDCVHICPGTRLAGEVKVGDRSWIGIGSSVIQQIRIGADVTVGAGAVVVRDLPDRVTAVGVPAKILPVS